jgi:serine beta-lactamase-like protein LACTB, mitochondrial
MIEQVFEPAGMTHTVAEHPDSVIAERGRYYSRADSTGPIVNAQLARFGDRLLRGRMVRPETLELLWTSMRASDGKPTDYGVGWTVERDSLGRRRVRHSGGSTGGTAHLIIYPDAGLVVALLVNSEYTFVGALSRYAEPFLAPKTGARSREP